MGSELASDCCIQNSPTCQQLLITPACPDDQDDDDDDIDHGDGDIDDDNDDGVFFVLFFLERRSLVQCFRRPSLTLKH